MIDNTQFVEEIIQTEFPECWEHIIKLPLIDYLYRKTRSVVRGSKARGSFGNLYALYVLVEDYIHLTRSNIDYTEYLGMQFTKALKRQRELPFGEKLQNHALNHRCNQEFLKFYPTYVDNLPIRRDTDTQRYWINEGLLQTECNGDEINISELIIKIINKYIELKREGFERFFTSLEQLGSSEESKKLALLIRQQLNPNVDARILK